MQKPRPRSRRVSATDLQTKTYNIPKILTGGFCPAVPDSERASVQEAFVREGLRPGAYARWFMSVSQVGAEVL